MALYTFRKIKLGHLVRRYYMYIYIYKLCTHIHIYTWDTAGLYTVKITVRHMYSIYYVSSRVQWVIQVVRIQWLVWPRAEGCVPNVSAQCVCAM